MNIDPRLLEVIRERRSPRAYADRAVPEEDLKLLFEAARWAASSYNEQPWRFLVAAKQNNPEDYRRLFDCLGEFNQNWAQNAPVVFLSVAKKTFTGSGDPNGSAPHDVGLAVGNLSLQAVSMGIFVHEMAGYDREKARKDLGIPDDFEPIAMGVLGYPGDPSILPDDLQAREVAPRARRELDEIVFTSKFGDSRNFG